MFVTLLTEVKDTWIEETRNHMKEKRSSQMWGTAYPQ